MSRSRWFGHFAKKNCLADPATRISILLVSSKWYCQWPAQHAQVVPQLIRLRLCCRCLCLDHYDADSRYECNTLNLTGGWHGRHEIGSPGATAKGTVSNMPGLKSTILSTVWVSKISKIGQVPWPSHPRRCTRSWWPLNLCDWSELSQGKKPSCWKRDIQDHAAWNFSQIWSVGKNM